MPPSGFRKIDLADGKRRELACRVVRESTAFDQDTSGRHEPLRQSRWLARVDSELAKTEALPGVP